MFRFGSILVCVICALSVRAADWSQGQWQILYTASTDSLLVVRGLNGSDGTVHLVLIVDQESGGYRYRYCQWSPSSFSGVIPWPNDLTRWYRDMNYDSVDHRQPAFLSTTTLWRLTPQGWDSLYLSDDNGYRRPQCMTFDSTGAIHYVVSEEYSLFYVREGGGRPTRRDTIHCGFELGCSPGNATRICAPRAESIVIVTGEDRNLLFQPNLWIQHFWYSPGDVSFTYTSHGLGVPCANPQLVLNASGEWIYGLYFDGLEQVKVWRGSDGLPGDVEVPFSSLTTNAFRVYANPYDSTFEIGGVMDESPSIIQFAVFDRELQTWMADTSFFMPTDHHTLHVMVDSLGRGHLFTVDSTHLWYFGPPPLGVEGDFILSPSSFLLSAHPNPFNPNTTISFALPKSETVKLAVFDVTGREVTVLADQPYAAGDHSVTFDGSALPSGLYFVHLQAGLVHKTQKVALIK